MAYICLKSVVNSTARCHQHAGGPMLAPAAHVARLPVVVRAADDSSPCNDCYMNAEMIAWNAKHGAVLRQRIAQLQAKEATPKPVATRLPKLPPVEEINSSDVERTHAPKWHDDPWARLAAAQEGMWDDELGHFGCPSS